MMKNKKKAAKIKPNEQCPCNSGKKYKKCCSLKQVLPAATGEQGGRRSSSSEGGHTNNSNRNKKSGKSHLKKEAKKAAAEQNRRKEELLNRNIVPESANNNNSSLVFVFEKYYSDSIMATLTTNNNSNSITIVSNCNLMDRIPFPDDATRQSFGWPEHMIYPSFLTNDSVDQLYYFVAKVLKPALNDLRSLREYDDVDGMTLPVEAIYGWKALLSIESQKYETLAWALEMCRSPYMISPIEGYYNPDHHHHNGDIISALLGGGGGGDGDGGDDNDLHISHFVPDMMQLMKCLLKCNGNDYEEEEEDEDSDDGVDDDDDGTLLRLTSKIMHQLIPIYQLLCTSESFETVDYIDCMERMMKEHTTEDGYWTLFEELESSTPTSMTPRRGNLAMIAGAICQRNYYYHGKDGDNEDDDDDESSCWTKFTPHVEQLCTILATKIVSDPTTDPETNGLCFDAVYHLIENPDWVEPIMDMLLEPFRNCCTSGNLDTSCVGDLSAFLMKANDTIVPTRDGGKQEKNQKNDADPYEYFLNIYSSNPQGITSCNCSKHGIRSFPLVVCNALQKNGLIDEISTSLKHIDVELSSLLSSTSSSSSSYKPALSKINSVLHMLESELNSHMVYDEETEKRKRILEHKQADAYNRLGQCYFGMKNYQRAVESFEMDEYFRVKPTAVVGKITYASRNKLSRVESMFSLARSLAYLPFRNKEALAWATQVIVILTTANTTKLDTSTNTTNYPTIDIVEQFMDDVKKGKFVPSLLSSSSQQQNRQTQQNVVVKKKGAPSSLDAVPCWVRRCSWYSAGSVESDDGSFDPVSIVIERLHYVLVWIRDKLLVWDYQQNYVVQWIEFNGYIESPSGKHKQGCTSWKCIDTTPTSTICVIFTEYEGMRVQEDCYAIVVEELDRLPRGSTSDIDTAMVVTLGCEQYVELVPSKMHCLSQTSTELDGPLSSSSSSYGSIHSQLRRQSNFTTEQIFGSHRHRRHRHKYDDDDAAAVFFWRDVLSKMCADIYRRTDGGTIARFDAIQGSGGDRSWSLALMPFGRTSTTRCDNNSIYVYHGPSSIVPGCDHVLGPLALLSEKPTRVLRGHTKALYSIGFVPTTQNLLLVSTANDRTMKVWDLEEDDAECCRHTICDFNMLVKHVTCSMTFIFATSGNFSNFGNKEKQQQMFGCCCVEVFDLDTANHVASLQHNATVENIVYDETKNLLYVSLKGGNLHLWRINDGIDNDDTLTTAVMQFSHIHGLKLFSNDHHGYMIPHLNVTSSSSSSIIVSTLKELLWLSDPCRTTTDAAVDDDSGGDISIASPEAFDAMVKDDSGSGKLQNCGYCYQYKVTSQKNTCSKCKLVRYCDRSCQKKGWKNHKLFCAAAAAS